MLNIYGVQQFEELRHFVEIETEYGPFIQGSKASSSQVFSDYKAELLHRRKQAAADQMKDSASKTLLESALFERGVAIASPMKYQRDSDAVLGASFLTALLDEAGAEANPNPNHKPRSAAIEYSSPLRNGYRQHSAGSSTTPAMRSALAGPTTRLQNITDKRALRLRLMAKVDALLENEKGGDNRNTNSAGEGETIEMREFRAETNEQYRRRVSAFTKSQSRDFNSRYAAPNGFTVDELVGADMIFYCVWY